MTSTIDVRPFEDASEYERMIDYFVGADESFLRGMGVVPGSSRRERRVSRLVWRGESVSLGSR